MPNMNDKSEEIGNALPTCLTIMVVSANRRHDGWSECKGTHLGLTKETHIDLLVSIAQIRNADKTEYTDNNHHATGDSPAKITKR